MDWLALSIGRSGSQPLEYSANKSYCASNAESYCVSDAKAVDTEDNIIPPSKTDKHNNLFFIIFVLSIE